ncbi:MAG TPA: lipid A deacylase LpxR family protein [Opitutaceae bacterium]|jgi:lipid A 3-O-deacylase|nr:lipid A deacylase LpxR family protein [Opitutaceae bacterium]
MSRQRFALPGLFIVGLLTSASLSAQSADTVSTERARSAPTFTVYFENDVFANTDRHYTNGVKLSWLSADLTSWGQTGWRQSFLNALPFVNRPEGQKNFGVALGQNIYTPQNISASVPDPKDRPYAGWSYLEFAFISKTPAIADTISIQLGIVGPHSYAEETQRIVHEWIDSTHPRGWDHQLHDEPGVNLIYERRWRLYARTLANVLGLDLVPHAGASLGNVQTYANAGGTLRLGLNLPSDFGVQLARPGSIGGTPADDLDPRVALDRNFSLFVFTAADGRAVGRDIFLDGNTFRSSPSVDKEPFVADLSAGVGLIAGRWQFTFTEVARTREFKTERESHDDFGSVTVSRAF